MLKDVLGDVLARVEARLDDDLQAVLNKGAGDGVSTAAPPPPADECADQSDTRLGYRIHAARPFAEGCAALSSNSWMR